MKSNAEKKKVFMNIDPTDLMGVHELSTHLGVTRQRLHQLRSNPGFPPPLITLHATPVWHRPRIDRWLASWSRTPGPIPKEK